MTKKKKFILGFVFLDLLIIFFITLLLIDKKADAPDKTDQQNNTTQTESPAPVAPVFDKAKYSIDDPASIWVIVNKKRPLPSSYAPNDLVGQLRSEPSGKLQELLAAAAANGASMRILSGYRSYATQNSTYNAYVAKDGQAAADRYSARPGHSEHQTGLAADLGNGTCDLEICFGTTVAGKWLAANAHTYGFTISYPESKEAITGYQYEPWHIRYVGIELASELKKANQTLGEFFGLPATPSY